VTEATAERSTEAGGPRAPRRDHERSLTSEEKRVVAVLGVPTLALALATTVVTTYLPVVAQEFVGSTVVIGLIVGLEGLVALWLPLVVGTWSDRLRTRVGGRLPFLIAATPVVVAGLVAMSLVGSVAALAASALLFFLGYFVAYEPYRALYPDTVGEEIAGRAQSTQALWRGLGTGVALISGGLLLGLGAGAPFLAAAGVFVVCMAAFGVALRRRGVPKPAQQAQGGPADAARQVIALVREHASLRAFLVANALWELSLATLKTFVVLYVTKGLGYSRSTGALIIGGVALVVLLAAVTSGKLADRYGHLAVLRIGLPVYGLGFLIPFLLASPVAVALSVPFIAVGGGIIMTLPYAVLMPLMPDTDHGALTGYYSLSRGLGTWLGPLLGGIAVAALADVFSETSGYQAIWGVCAASTLLSLIPLRRLASARGGGA
jgi:MFS family permease